MPDISTKLYKIIKIIENYINQALGNVCSHDANLSTHFQIDVNCIPFIPYHILLQ